MKIREQLKKLKFKLKKKSWLIIATVTGIAALIGYASRYYLPYDNIIEEKCEQLIEKTTGFDIDLSPSSPEFYDRYVAMEIPDNV